MTEKNLSIDDLMSSVVAMSGEERIFVSIDIEFSKKFNSILYRKEAMDNAFLSYLNKTYEDADETTEQIVLDRIAEIHIEYKEFMDGLFAAYLPQDVYTYLKINDEKYRMYINPDVSCIVIELAKSKHGFGCACHPGQHVHP